MQEEVETWRDVDHLEGYEVDGFKEGECYPSAGVVLSREDLELLLGIVPLR